MREEWTECRQHSKSDPGFYKRGCVAGGCWSRPHWGRLPRRKKYKQGQKKYIQGIKWCEVDISSDYEWIIRSKLKVVLWQLVYCNVGLCGLDCTFVCISTSHLDPRLIIYPLYYVIITTYVVCFNIYNTYCWFFNVDSSNRLFIQHCALQTIA